MKLETIGPNEEGFLIPYTGDTKKQTSTNNEEFLRANLVATKQIRVPQQWIQLGYETTGWNGEWRDAAKLIKVDKSPVTREWTADPNTGTSNRNEAIWVMTSDQVEFSTGWTCTARIATRDDAVKFLHNYPSGSLQSVMDTEVRAKLQAEFGLEVTDLPMDELRKNATPHFKRVVETLTTFFSERGITITNLGISGGFVYKDKAIQDMLVKVFNAEQQKSISIARTQAAEGGQQAGPARGRRQGQGDPGREEGRGRRHQGRRRRQGLRDHQGQGRPDDVPEAQADRAGGQADREVGRQVPRVLHGDRRQHARPAPPDAGRADRDGPVSESTREGAERMPPPRRAPAIVASRCSTPSGEEPNADGRIQREHAPAMTGQELDVFSLRLLEVVPGVHDIHVPPFTGLVKSFRLLRRLFLPLQGESRSPGIPHGSARILRSVRRPPE